MSYKYQLFFLYFSFFSQRFNLIGVFFSKFSFLDKAYSTQDIYIILTKMYKKIFALFEIKKDIPIHSKLFLLSYINSSLGFTRFNFKKIQEKIIIFFFCNISKQINLCEVKKKKYGIKKQFFFRIFTFILKKN